MPQRIIFSIFFFPLIVFIGVVTSLEDFKSSKIRNKWVLTGLIYCFLVYFFSWILYGLALGKIVSPIIGNGASYFIWNFDKWCINLAISTVVAYLLWHYKMWAAGDAKLFIAYAALIPMGQYTKAYFNYYFASFLLLLSIFIPATIFLFLKAIFYFIKKINFRELKEVIPGLIKDKFTKIKVIEGFKILLGFFALFLSFRILRQEFSALMGRFLPNQNILMLLSLLAFRRLSKIFKRKSKSIFLVFIVLVIYFLAKIQNSGSEYLFLMFNSISRSILIILLYPVVTKIVSLYEDNIIKKSTPFAIWMFLGALITWFI